MSRILVAVLGASMLAGTLPAKSDGTWIQVFNTPLKKPTPGTIADEYGWWGTGWYVDVKSIVKRGNKAYFNSSLVLLGQTGRPCLSSVCGWDKTKAAPERKVSDIANCSTLQLIKADGSPKGKQGDISYALAKFACE
jgi:hypothetical protein